MCASFLFGFEGEGFDCISSCSCLSFYFTHFLNKLKNLIYLLEHNGFGMINRALTLNLRERIMGFRDLIDSDKRCQVDIPAVINQQN